MNWGGHPPFFFFFSLSLSCSSPSLSRQLAFPAKPVARCRLLVSPASLPLHSARLQLLLHRNLIPGYKIRILVTEALLAWHGNNDGFLCPQIKSPSITVKKRKKKKKERKKNRKKFKSPGRYTACPFPSPSTKFPATVPHTVLNHISRTVNYESPILRHC